MKRFVWRRWVATGALLLTVALGSTPVFARAPGAPEYGRAIPVQSTMVRYFRALVTMHIRSGPGYQYSVIEHIYPGNKVPVTGLSLDGLWWRVPCPPDGMPGDCFVARNRFWTIPARPYSPNEPFPVLATSVRQIRMLMNVNIRSGPDIGYSRLGYLEEDAVTAVHGVSLDGNWYQVDCPRGGVNGNCFVTAKGLYTEPAN